MTLTGLMEVGVSSSVCNQMDCILAHPRNNSLPGIDMNRHMNRAHGLHDESRQRMDYDD